MNNTKQSDKCVMWHTTHYKGHLIALSCSSVHIRYLCLC